LRGWITLGVLIVAQVFVWWFLYKRWLHVYFRNPRTAQTTNKAKDIKPVPLTKAAKSRRAEAPSDDISAIAVAKKPKTDAVVKTLSIKSKGFPHPPCCPIRSLLSKVRKHKSTQAKQNIHSGDPQ
jgi:cytoskeletal protein RodZ